MYYFSILYSFYPFITFYLPFIYLYLPFICLYLPFIYLYLPLFTFIYLYLPGFLKTVTTSKASNSKATVMGKKRKTASTRTATRALSGRRHSDRYALRLRPRRGGEQGAEPASARRSPGPRADPPGGATSEEVRAKHVDPAGRSRSYAVESRIPLQAEGTEVVCAGAGHTRPRGRHDSETGQGNAEEVRAHASRRVMGLPRAYFDSMYLQEDFGWDYNP